MATQTRAERRAGAALNREQLLAAYRTMYLSRRLDDKEIQLKGQNKIFFQISGAGHEAVLTAAGMALRGGHDWFFPYYRDRALCLQLGMTPAEMLYEAVGAARDPNSGGRQMPSHWGSKRLNIVSSSSPTGTQFLHSTGCAEASLRASLLSITEGFESDEVTYVSAGDGTTSEGEFWESLNTACNLSLPVVYLIEDNGYAISVPVEVNTAGGSISKLVASMPGLLIQEVDGCDLVASYAAMSKAVGYARARRGPALVHAHVIRPYSHSLSDQETMYRPPEERDADAARDPLVTFPRWLVAEGHITEQELEALKAEVDAEILAATDDALAQPQPTADTVLYGVYSPDVDPTSEQFDTEDDPKFTGEPTTMVDLLNVCMKDEMHRDGKILVFGEDVADVSRAVPGQGEGQGRRVQSDVGAAEGVRRRPCLQFSVSRSEHRRPSSGLGGARLQARGRDPILRLHLARVYAVAQRARHHALALEQRLQRARRGARDVRRIHPRCDLPFANRRVAVHALSGVARGVSVYRARCERAVADGDPLRRPRDLPRAQAPLSPDVQQGPQSRAELHDSVR